MKITLTIATICLALNASAQMTIGLHGKYFAPANEFADSNYNDGGGFSFEIHSNDLLRKTPLNNKIGLQLGGFLDFAFAGHRKFDIVLNTPNSDPGILKASNSHIGLLADARLLFNPNGKLIPYVSAFAGPRFFITSEEISAKGNLWGFEESTSNNIRTGSTFHYGFSLGAMYALTKGVYLDGRVWYSKGTATNWVYLPHVHLVDGLPNYTNTRFSETDLMGFKLGFIFKPTWTNSNTSSGSSTKESTPSPRNRNSNIIRNSPRKKQPLTPKPTPKPTPPPINY